MREEKLYIKLDGYEQSILVRALNDLRNSLLENARSQMRSMSLLSRPLTRSGKQ